MFKFLWDFMFPVRCLGGCGRYDEWLCRDCARQFHGRKLGDDLYFISDYGNELMQKLIHGLKYGYCEELGPVLGKLLREAVDEEFDYCLPAPVSRKRKRERGFNQAELLCRPLGIPINKGLVKIRHTRPQMTLDRAQRLSNLDGCFRYRNDNIDIAGKKLLLVDDVWTTGATMREMTKELQKFGPKAVKYAVLAKGEG